MRTLYSVLFAAALSGACTGSAQVHAEADYQQPQLVEVQPGVQVVADYDQPVFFNEGAYWRYDGGIWYRSRYHDRAWLRVETPPVAIAHIERPEIYVHYRGAAKVQADERRENHDVREMNHDASKADHENAEVAHDRAEVKHDEAKGNEHAEEHDRKELKHDEKEQARDRKEERKDEKKVDKDEHKRAKDERKEERSEAHH